jgi:hypothetical protein
MMRVESPLKYWTCDVNCHACSYETICVTFNHCWKLIAIVWPSVIVHVGWVIAGIWSLAWTGVCLFSIIPALLPTIVLPKGHHGFPGAKTMWCLWHKENFTCCTVSYGVLFKSPMCVSQAKKYSEHDRVMKHYNGSRISVICGCQCHSSYLFSLGLMESRIVLLLRWEF